MSSTFIGYWIEGDIVHVEWILVKYAHINLSNRYPLMHFGGWPFALDQELAETQCSFIDFGLCPSSAFPLHDKVSPVRVRP